MRRHSTHCVCAECLTPTWIEVQLPCPMACGRMTDDPAGGPCAECWAEVRATPNTEEDDG